MLRKLLGPGKHRAKISQQPITFWSLAYQVFEDEDDDEYEDDCNALRTAASLNFSNSFHLLT